MTDTEMEYLRVWPGTLAEQLEEIAAEMEEEEIARERGWADDLREIAVKVRKLERTLSGQL